MPRPVRLTKSLASADADGVCLSQTPLAAGNLTLNGVFASGSPAVAVLDTPRRVLFTFAADETGHTFVVYGTNAVSGGSPIQETVAGTTAGTVATTLDFGTVTRISIDAAATGAMTVGTNGVGATAWQLIDNYLDPTNARISIDVVGTVNYTLQYTDDDIMGSWNGGLWVQGYPTKIWDDPIVAAVTTDQVAVQSNPAGAWRVQINSGTGTLRIVGTQAGVGGVGS